jgi:hypothetical protein
MAEWVEEELTGLSLGDKRLDRRLRLLMERLGQKPGLSIPAACKGLAETMAAYRFFDNEQATPEGILRPHFESSVSRMEGSEVVLVVQDTTELDFTGKQDIEGLGPLNYEERTGFLCHASLALSGEGLCLGVLDAQMWSRPPGGGSVNAQRKQKPIEQKESYRWIKGYERACELADRLPATTVISVADREGDIYELFVEGEGTGGQGRCAEWIVRACQDRSLPDLQDGKAWSHQKLWATLEQAPILGMMEYEIAGSAKRKTRRIKQHIQSKRIVLKAPFRKDVKLPPVEVTGLLASEIDAPQGEEPVQWLLLSSMRIDDMEQAQRVIEYYLCRWQVEVYFRVLKSGCKIEELQLETLDRLKRCVAVYLIIAWRTMFVTRLGRACPELSCKVLFEDEEWKSVYVIVRQESLPEQAPRLGEFVKTLASLGGYLGRKNDGPPGPMAIWIGLQRTTDFAAAWRAFGPES